MGLRVATLVNLTFIGGDRARRGSRPLTPATPAERASFPMGSAALPPGRRCSSPSTSRAAPTGTRPGPAPSSCASSGAPFAKPVWDMFAAYLAAGILCLIAAVVIRRVWRGRVPAAGPAAANVPRKVLEGREVFGLANGFMRMELSADGRGYTTIEGAARGGAPADISKRPDDALQIVGPFLYIQDGAASGLEPRLRADADRQPRLRRWRRANPVAFACATASGGVKATAQRQPRRGQLRRTVAGHGWTNDTAGAKTAAADELPRNRHEQSGHLSA